MINQKIIDWLRGKRPTYDEKKRLWYFQCAYADASDTYWTLPSYLYDAVKSGNVDRSYLRTYYKSPARVLWKLHRWLDIKQKSINALEY